VGGKGVDESLRVHACLLVQTIELGQKMKIRMMGVATVAALSIAGEGHSATLVASYLFNNTLASSVAGAPNLVLTDPSGTSGYITDNYGGGTRTVLHIGGANTPPSQQGGLTFNSTGLLTPDSYSVALSFRFEGGTSAWRRILDVRNRQSDNGFYVDPNNLIDIFPVAGSAAVPFVTNTYENVVLIVGPSGPNNVHGYIQGVGSFTSTTDEMDIANPDNPGNLINLFLDNVIAGGQGEWSASDIAVANFYNGILSADDVSAFNNNPTGTIGGGGVPEPATWLMMLVGFAGLGAALRSHRLWQRKLRSVEAAA
jgi:hypothetical protein